MPECNIKSVDVTTTLGKCCISLKNSQNHIQEYIAMTPSVATGYFKNRPLSSDFFIL